MDPKLVTAFAEEYIAERNRPASSHTNVRTVKEKEPTKVIKDQDVLVDAILAGTPADRIKSKLEQLELRQKQLGRELAHSPAASSSSIRIHPMMAQTYHERIKALVQGLTNPDQESEARDAVRGLIEEFVATPVATCGKRMRLDLQLHGDLAEILALSLGTDLLVGQKNLLRTGGYGKCSIFGCGDSI
jgi:site-specific DNA recombinase